MPLLTMSLQAHQDTLLAAANLKGLAVERLPILGTAGTLVGVSAANPGAMVAVIHGLIPEQVVTTKLGTSVTERSPHIPKREQLLRVAIAAALTHAALEIDLNNPIAFIDGCNSLGVEAPEEILEVLVKGSWAIWALEDALDGRRPVFCPLEAFMGHGGSFAGIQTSQRARAMSDCLHDLAPWREPLPQEMTPGFRVLAKALPALLFFGNEQGFVSELPIWARDLHLRETGDDLDASDLIRAIRVSCGERGIQMIKQATALAAQ